MESFNAIRVGDKIEKTYIDFSSYESLTETSGFAKLYTIHTAETNAISNKLGLHIGGFCDDRGNGGPDLAAEIAGYPSLPSDLILCLMDDKYNFLPLDEKQLYALFVYLKTGDVINTSWPDTAIDFFNKYSIYPVTPNFGEEAKAITFDQYPTVILLSYELSFDGKDDAYITRIGQLLFNFADRIVNEFEEVDDLRLDKDGEYFIKTVRDVEKSSFNVFIQALTNTDDKPLLNKVIKLYNNEEEDEVVEDAIEEVMEDDDEWKEEDRYVLTFKVSCDWPEDPEKFHYSGTFAYPFFADNKDIEPFFPYFNYLFTVEGIDTIHGLVTLKLKMGEEEKLIDVAFDKPVSIDFDYNNHPENKASHRVGHAEFNLYKFFYTKEGFPGKLKVHEFYDDNNGIKIDNNHYFEKISDDVEDDVRLEDGQIMYIGFTAADDDFILAYSTDQDPDDEDKINYIYYPIFIGQELKVSSSFYPDGGDKKVNFNFDISYEEPVLDGYILKIDSKFSYRDTYDEAEKEGHDELEIINKNKIRLQSCFRYVHVANIDNELHEATVFIGESDNPKYCQAYEVSLNKEAHFIYRFNGGANDNFHAEYVDIIVRMEKK